MGDNSSISVKLYVGKLFHYSNFDIIFLEIILFFKSWYIFVGTMRVRYINYRSLDRFYFLSW